MENAHMTHEVTVHEGYQLWAAQYDQEDNALIVIEERLTKPLLTAIPATRVLDLGTGTGRYAIYLAEQGAQVVALDQSEAMLSIAQHTTEDYLAAFSDAGFHIQTVQEALVSDAPKDLFPADVIARDGNKPFCLAILATKPTH